MPNKKIESTLFLSNNEVIYTKKLELNSHIETITKTMTCELEGAQEPRSPDPFSGEPRQARRVLWALQQMHC